MKELPASLRSQRGQALPEFAVAFPLQLLMTMGIIQLCLIIVAAIVVNYSAEAAARAELVGEDPHRAASMICSTVTGSTWNAALSEGIRVPGWGELPNSRQALKKTRVTIDTPLYDSYSAERLCEVHPRQGNTATIVAYVEHDFELIIPVVDFMTQAVFDVVKIDGAWHMTLRARGTQQVPWADEPMGAGHAQITDIGD